MTDIKSLLPQKLGMVSLLVVGVILIIIGFFLGLLKWLIIAIGLVLIVVGGIKLYYYSKQIKKDVEKI